MRLRSLIPSLLALPLLWSLGVACTPLPPTPADASLDAPLALTDGGADADPVVGRACGPGSYCPCGYFCPAGRCEVAEFHPPCDL